MSKAAIIGSVGKLDLDAARKLLAAKPALRSATRRCCNGS